MDKVHESVSYLFISTFSTKKYHLKVKYLEISPNSLFIQKKKYYLCCEFVPLSTKTFVP